MNRNLAKTCLTGLALVLVLGGCFGSGAARAPANGAGAQQNEFSPERRFKARPPINTNRNLYEGSLWRGAASWGNLMRDHRARYRGDLLTVTDVPKIINVPEPVQENLEQQQRQQQQGGQEQQEQVDPVIAFLRAEAKRRERIEQEQNEILRSINTIEVEVARVLPNGNLLVRGVHPPIFRNRARVKYVVTLQGIVRPSDVDDKNQIPAPRLSKADYKIRRLVRRSLIPTQAGSVAEAAGSKRGGAFLDRLSNFLSTPGRSRGPGR